jgi:tRNA-modifying protein YgfZ
VIEVEPDDDCGSLRDMAASVPEGLVRRNAPLYVYRDARFRIWRMTHPVDLNALHPVRLAHLGALRVVGPDASLFLQGQLSAEITALRPTHALLAACNSAQGRVQAVTWLIERDDGVALVLPESMMESVAARLRKYVLRAKVKVESGAGRLIAGVVNADVLAHVGELSADRAHVQHAGISFVRLPGHAQILLLANSPSWGEPDLTSDMAWRLEHLRAGLPQVYPETHETFVAQMLNLDLLDAISFTKGCYTGQEIIARTHYRGAIKRRMFRFRAPCPPPAPGTRIAAGDQHAGDVLEAVAVADGCELLAVVSLAQIEQRLALESSTGAVLERLALPYEIATP